MAGRCGPRCDPSEILAGPREYSLACGQRPRDNSERKITIQLVAIGFLIAGLW
jgi:hypothetical protein